MFVNSALVMAGPGLGRSRECCVCSIEGASDG